MNQRSNELSGEAVELPGPFADEAKLRILQAAESLFAERAIESVSLREIALASGHANTNAVQYHFGGRDALVQAIFAWRVWQMEAPRGHGLARAEAEGKLAHLPTLMEVLCLPFLDLVDQRGRHTYAAFMSQYLLRQRPAGIRHAIDNRPDIAANGRRLVGLIFDQVGVIDRDEGDYRIALAHMLFSNMLVLADNESLEDRDPDAFRQHVSTGLRMATAALSAGIA